MVSEALKFLSKVFVEAGGKPPAYRVVKLVTISMEDEVLNETWRVERFFCDGHYLPEKDCNSPEDAIKYCELLNSM